MAPFWDDVDIRGGNGQISYQTYQSGSDLDQVSSFLESQKNISFQGTWMLVVFWDAVHPYFGASRSEVKKISIHTIVKFIIGVFFFSFRRILSKLSLLLMASLHTLCIHTTVTQQNGALLSLLALMLLAKPMSTMTHHPGKLPV